jgi:hypothetical protein
MYRACSTWQYEVVAHLVERYRGGRRVGYVSGDQYRDSRQPGAGVGSSPRASTSRVLKSHEGHRYFARAIAGGCALAIYAHRDVREVAFSLMHKRGITFDQLLRQGMIQQVLANDRFWTRQPGVLIQRYDQVLADPESGVIELARFLGIVLPDGEAAEIARTYSLESNKARTQALRRELEQRGLDLTSAANAQICDATTLLHWNHVREGVSAPWYREATQRQRAVLDRLCGRWLDERGYDREPATVGTRTPGDSPLAWRVRAGIETDLALARLAYQVRWASQRFPRLARVAKRILGIPTPEHVGATVWSDPGGPDAAR